MQSRFITLLSLILFAVLLMVPSYVAAANADLAIDSVTFEPAQPLMDQVVKIKVKIKYTGSNELTTNIGVNNLAFAHKDFKQDVSTENGTSITPSTYSPLHSGDYFTYTIVGRFTSVGDKTLVLKIDGSNKLVESDEKNNTIKPVVKILKFGDLVKIVNDSAIYLIKDDGRKHLFVNGPTFWSYYRGSWSKLKLDDWPVYITEISQAAFDSLVTGKNIIVKSGSRLVKFQNSPKIYTVFGTAKLKELSEQTALALYDTKWREKVITIQNGFESDYIKSNSDYLDTDGDGLADEDERNIYHTNPVKADSDGDNYRDGIEVFNDYNPNI